ncbi:MAG: diguanylate cyclase, partial [Tannerella sp.]|nr:diguanylate cyclase [Tannerella sp.]
MTLRNPLIVGSSGLTNSVKKNKGLEDAGAGAVVLKSLFEEQIEMQG